MMFAWAIASPALQPEIVEISSAGHVTLPVNTVPMFAGSVEEQEAPASADYVHRAAECGLTDVVNPEGSEAEKPWAVPGKGRKPPVGWMPVQPVKVAPQVRGILRSCSSDRGRFRNRRRVSDAVLMRRRRVSGIQ